MKSSEFAIRREAEEEKAAPSGAPGAQENREKSARLAEYGNMLAQACEEAGKWVSRNDELVRNEKESLLKDLRKARRALKKCGKAAATNVNACVFGPSQAGKSYLVSILAQGGSDTLWARFGDDKKLNFVQEINPDGGKESTGLVTRFTMTRPETLPEGFPVQIKLLSETDLVKIIANAYYSDFKHKEDRKSDIRAALDSLKKSAGSPNQRITLDDMEDLREYIKTEFNDNAGVKELEKEFWEDACALAPKLSLENRVRLYSLIWDGVEQLNDVMLYLLKALDSVGYAESLCCSLDALTPKDKSIIDVDTLKRLYQDENDQIAVRTPSGTEKTLPRSVATALTAELIIVMEEKPAEYFDHTDLLDFPGYRSREKLPNPREALQDEKNFFEVLVRGKVAYLFQRYCADRELNNMLLCIPPSNQEVKDLPGVIDAWISTTHGATPEERRNKRVSLLFVLTKSDENLKFKEGAQDVSGRWDTVLKASMLNFFGMGYDWPTHWTPERGFDNIFLLRNTKFSCDLIEKKDKKEAGILPDMKGLRDDLEKAFLGSALVREHFHDPKRAFDELLSFNDGGISYIRQSLAPLCNPEIKRRQLIQNIESLRSGILGRLSAFYQSDDKEELRAQKTALADSLWDGLYNLEDVKHGLGELINSFTLKDSDLYDLYPEALRRFREYKEEQEEKQRQSAQEKTQAAGTGARKNPFKEKKEQKLAHDKGAESLTQDEDGFYAAYIESKWVEKMRALADNKEAQEYFMLPQQDFSGLVSELATGSARLGFKDALAKKFREISSYANTNRDTIVKKQASVAAQTFNDYIDLLGVSPSAKSDSERSVTSQDGETHVVFKPHNIGGGLPVLDEEKSVYMDDWFGDWFNALGGLIMDNVYFDGSQTINVAENTALGNILSSFKRELTDMA